MYGLTIRVKHCLGEMETCKPQTHYPNRNALSKKSLLTITVQVCLQIVNQCKTAEVSMFSWN